MCFTLNSMSFMLISNKIIFRPYPPTTVGSGLCPQNKFPEYCIKKSFLGNYLKIENILGVEICLYQLDDFHLVLRITESSITMGGNVCVLS